MTPEEARRELFDQLARCEREPLRFCRWAFAWGEGELAACDGPDAWQREQMEAIDAHLHSADWAQPYLDATASGHGIGKSAEVAWLTLWALMTMPHTRGVVTANTATQLETKTWAELRTWFNRLIKPLRDLFECEVKSIHAKGAHARTWRVDAIPWSINATEGFAGLHNQGKRIIVVFDEGSAIPDLIWEVTEGALTDRDTEILWLVYGNPTRGTGRFKGCFTGPQRSQWRTRKIDSRTVRITNKDQIEKWRVAYGEDSDFFRVRVRGEFPRAATSQFIADDLVQAARKRDPGYIASDPFVFGLDVAYMGDDKNVLTIRRGRDAKTFPRREWLGNDPTILMTVAGDVATTAAEYEAITGEWPHIFVDEGGVGAGVVSRLAQLNIPNVIGVNFGGKGGVVDAGLDIRTANKAATMWARMREWLRHGAIADRDELQADLTGREYGYDADNAIQLERKKDMKKRGLASPDEADSLALTFAEPVAPLQVRGFGVGKSRVTESYDLYAALR